MKIAVYSAQPYDRRFLDEARATLPGVEAVYFSDRLELDTVPLAQGCTAVCVFVNDILDAPVLEALHAAGVRAVLLRCAGFNNVDLHAGARLGLFMARVPAYAPEAVAEHALALVMTLNRRTHRAYVRVREGNFALDGLLGMTLHGKTVGIVGAGQIGACAARIFHGLGCKVLVSDPAPTPQLNGVAERTSLDAVLAQSDIVSLHCPLMDATRHMINSDSLAGMKRGAMLVNTSRGGLIDTAAVIDALKSGQLGALAIDVYEQESTLFFQDHSSDIIADDVFQRLMTFPNVLVTGHQGFFTIEAMREIAAVTFANLACHMQDSPCANALPHT
ncbi:MULTISPECIES: 2-hydroxyacid dehydrogenase [unclassified Duganella]|jgi:D-lactate dehydrogenase|uniref:2-hydroxyacid dehydrogenase n=1 Tax=unclassified Duganella TaxID=2636909 RepID=UPI0008843370|nr:MULTISPECIES: 2-hydroxyacid dehydrogenase [unclassified Duganella]SDH08074.1 D-lactate dehydrogenase [Duganella sp. OV458]SDK18128.1 D-lactate dehydrogenase [Duganella sp. OV510]